jgi:hypothetical protein
MRGCSLLKMHPVAEWEFYQVSPDEVHLYRHRDGWILKAQVKEEERVTHTGECISVQHCTLHMQEYLPLYVSNKLREMLSLIEVGY